MKKLIICIIVISCFILQIAFAINETGSNNKSTSKIETPTKTFSLITQSIQSFIGVIIFDLFYHPQPKRLNDTTTN